MADTRRSVICKCGGDVYEKTLDDALQPVWRCDNCGAETPRRRAHRKTNDRRAIDAYLAIREEWKPLDAELDTLVKDGRAMGGALLVHCSTFNHHLNVLVNGEKKRNWDVRYHTEQAKADMAAARTFIEERSK